MSDAIDKATIIGEDLFQRILAALKNDPSSVGTSVSDWWIAQKDTITGVGIGALADFIRSIPTQNDEDLVAAYDKLLAGMTWAERLAFMQSSLDDMRVAASEKFRFAVLLGTIKNMVADGLPMIAGILGKLVGLPI